MDYCSDFKAALTGAEPPCNSCEKLAAVESTQLHVAMLIASSARQLMTVHGRD